MKDPIEREEAIDALKNQMSDWNDLYNIPVRRSIVILEQLPSAQPELNEWCPDCKEYDSKRHYCPRFNRVIREALKDVEPRKTGKWNFIGDNMFECTSCGVVYTTNQLNSLRNYDADPYAPKFCPSCGADMRGKENE